MIPRMADLKEPGQFEFKHFAHSMELWDNLDPGRINVISIEPFFPDPKYYSKEITEAFRAFILKARAHVFEDAGLVPMTIFIDELQWLIPSERTALCREHNEGAKWMQRNLELLRSMQIRVIGATQGWGKLRPGARDSFGWLFLKRGARFGSYDRPKLAERNRLWQSLCDACYVIVRPDMVYADVMYKSQFYGNTRKKGMVRYHEDKGGVSHKVPAKAEV